MNNQNSALMEIIITMLSNWKIYILAFTGYKLFKFALTTYFEVKKIQYLNKDSFSIRVDNNSKEISISTSQKINIAEIEKALSAHEKSNLIELDFKKDKAS